ncbi:MAG: exodeoxyribonuclease VII small subunit [Candidatus Obscuribacter sp.]|nr:exodeoxyribonuclease VII small subunit [Candidatus Obscuribacter sp.]
MTNEFKQLSLLGEIPGEPSEQDSEQKPESKVKKEKKTGKAKPKESEQGGSFDIQPNKEKTRDEFMTTANEEKIDFEASLLELETVVKQLDSEVKLDKALKLFETGIKLSVDCEQFIKSAKRKIEILKKKADGTMELSDFSESDDNAQ